MDALTLGFMLAVDFFLSWEGLKYKGDIQFFSAGILALYALAAVATDNTVILYTEQACTGALCTTRPIQMVAGSQDFNLWLVLFALLAVVNFASIIEAHTRKEPEIG